ncbi:DNA-directed RNA polymerase subunit alpha [Rhabdochlamydiaceae symbiont of Dictyostelium giganteum]|uniref:DNA-directed RNA polymerase subunit alpha n=1 Tax=Rhabdochlamydiaceae symbiont of Dictyostelium giganteum TaxID=3342349 RepID=UPI00384CC57B
MTVKYGKFELPSKIKKDDSSKQPNFSRFIAEPFEKGFGHTIGNALRRTLLTAIESPAIMSVRIEGVSHEYTAIDGIIEDMTHIVLNFKSALIRRLPLEERNIPREPVVVSKVLEVTGDLLDKNGGQFIVTLDTLLGDSSFEPVNPDLALFTVTKPMFKKIDLKIGIGRGYIPSERQLLDSKNVDEIVLDAICSPVRRVNYYVENTRVGQDTDFDRLILDVETDGRITPEEALSFSVQIMMLHFDVFTQLEQHMITFDSDAVEVNSDKEALLAKLALKINEIELSVRSTNCLAGANIDTIGELVIMPESDMLKFRNFGKKSLNEIKAKLEEMELSLGMDLARFGITKDNVRQIVDDYLAQKGVETEV